MPGNKRLEIQRLDAETFEVSVTGRVPTRHRVSLTEATCRGLTGSRVSPEALIEFSFSFLLDREPNTSILPRFDLDLISRYFPEFHDAIRTWVAGNSGLAERPEPTG